MRVSQRWLEDFVEIDVPPKKLAELLDLSGTKVESVTRPDEGVSGVVVAEVVDIRTHPNADNLTLVDAKVSESEVHHVVCGAKNFEVGDRVPLAKVGARLPDMEITERKIRGEVSRGMLCSGMELGVSRDHSGILVLPPDAPLDEDVTRVLGLDDTIYELEITSNRPDCLSVIGIAREISVVLDTELKIPQIQISSEGAAPVKVTVDDARGCPRYLARYIEGVAIGPSPLWMAARLLAAGVRPISNVVDVTNYVMLEYGQPLHAFDSSLVHDQTIVVRRARRGERMRTLDGIERDLDTDDLLITDPKRPLAIAGVMGGEESEVRPETANVILESAHFSPPSVALTARRHGLRTEASARFERGTDPQVVPIAADRAAQLMSELAGGNARLEPVDVHPVPAEPRRIVLRPSRSDAVLGAPLAAEIQADYLRRLGMEVAEADGTLDVTVPTFRPDVSREEDLIEEVGRIAGFERLPATLPPGRTGGLDRGQRFERRVRELFTDLGVAEAWSPSLQRTGELDALGLGDDHPARRTVMLANPMSDEEQGLRTTLVPGLLRSVARNFAQRADSIALFEIARVYEPTDDLLPDQPLVVAAAFSGQRVTKQWGSEARSWDFFAAKGVVDAALACAGIHDAAYEPVGGMPFHPTRAAAISIGGRRIGSIGQLHPDVCNRFDAPDPTICFEVALQPLIDALPERETTEDLSRFPATFVDIAVVVDEATPAALVTGLIRDAGAPELAGLKLFDLYRGEQVPAGKKSLAYALELRSMERTFTDEDAAAVRDRVMTVLQERLGASLRS